MGEGEKRSGQFGLWEKEVRVVCLSFGDIYGSKVFIIVDGGVIVGVGVRKVCEKGSFQSQGWKRFLAKASEVWEILILSSNAQGEYFEMYSPMHLLSLNFHNSP